jgi:Flp pilus assembly protein TadG
VPHGGVARRKREGERGAALVEAAFVLPFVALLVFAVVELGMVFRSATVAANASRAGAREMASTFPNAPDNAARTTVLGRVGIVVEEALRDRSSTDTPQELRIYLAQADGSPSDTSGACDTRCVTYTWNAATTTWVYSTGSWNDPVACGATMDRVGVSIRLSHGGSVGPWRFTRPISERTVMRLEPSVLCG